MVVSQDHVDADTAMGAALVADGATFRVWAPGAEHVYVVLGGGSGYQPAAADELRADPATGHWTGFVPGVAKGTLYRFLVVGPGGSGLKRDPWARELELDGYPDCDCLVVTDDYPWHDEAFVAPRFQDLVVYQLHIGVWFAQDAQGHDARPQRVAKLLDALDRVEYLADLGVTAVQPLPFVEFQGEWSLGYNGTDLFSPEMDYCVGPDGLEAALAKVNALLAGKGAAPLTAGQLTGQVNQLKAFVDVCHLYGIAVVADVVYNHAGGHLDAQSIDWFDFPAPGTAGANLYFTDADWAGGRVFDYAKPGVRDYLLGNALMFLTDYHVDGLRFDEVSVIDDHGGWSFCQQLTAALKARASDAVLVAEYWKDHRWLALLPPPDGMGFDLGYADGLRDGVRDLLAQVAHGASAPVDLAGLRHGLEKPANQPFAWQSYHCLENHDLVLDADGDHRHPRIARLADSQDSRSWYARSRTRVATGLLLTAPGVPLLFMGQEFLEDKLWSDNPHRPDLLVWWAGAEGLDAAMVDQHRWTRDLVRVRRTYEALRSDTVDVYHTDDANRVVAFHRWVPGASADGGQDVVVVASLSESSFEYGGYQLGLPCPGDWFEVLNSDVYDHFPNPDPKGNDGHLSAAGPPLHGQPASAGLTLPANGLLVLARPGADTGDIVPKDY